MVNRAGFHLWGVWGVEVVSRLCYLLKPVFPDEGPLATTTSLPFLTLTAHDGLVLYTVTHITELQMFSHPLCFSLIKDLQIFIELNDKCPTM